MQQSTSAQPASRTDAPEPGRAPANDGPWLSHCRRMVTAAQQLLYDRVLDVHVFGREHVPQQGGFLVAANHTSHLDAGLVKVALGERGAQLWALAAQDYFFSTPWKRWYFQNFSRILPLDRTGNIKGTLRRAVGTLRSGDPLLIFPEGTRSLDGRIASFKPAIASMALMAGCPILPVYLWGTHEAMPKGSLLLPVARRMGAVVGPPIPAEALRAATSDMPRNRATRVATACVELAVRGLHEGTPEPLDALLRRAVAATEAPAPAADRRPSAPPGGPAVPALHSIA